jgi:hypothetical protein
MSLDASGYDDHNIQAVLGSNFRRLLEAFGCKQR